MYETEVLNKITEYGFNPYLVVLGGSRHSESYRPDSDYDYAAYTTKIGLKNEQRYHSPTDNWHLNFHTDMDSYTAAYATVAKPDRDIRLYRWVHAFEGHLAHTVIQEDAPTMSTIRTDLLAIPKETIGQRYWWLAQLKPWAMGNPSDFILSLRLSLTGAYYVENSVLETNIDTLCAWVGVAINWNNIRDGSLNPDIPVWTIARDTAWSRIQTALGI